MMVLLVRQDPHGEIEESVLSCCSKAHKHLAFRSQISSRWQQACRHSPLPGASDMTCHQFCEPAGLSKHGQPDPMQALQSEQP